MKKNNDFVLRRIADSSVLVPFGSKAINFHCLQKEDEAFWFMWTIDWSSRCSKMKMDSGIFMEKYFRCLYN